MNKNISLIVSLLILFSCQEMPKKVAEEAESKTLIEWETLSKKRQLRWMAYFPK